MFNGKSNLFLWSSKSDAPQQLTFSETIGISTMLPKSDGSGLFFMQDGTLKSCNWSYENIQVHGPLSDARYLRLNPAGNKIIYSNLDKQIWTCNTDGSGNSLLHSESSLIGSANYINGGNNILFASNSSGDSEFYKMNADGTGIQNLTAGYDGKTNSPEPAANADVVVFRGDEGVYAMNKDGGNIRLILAVDDLDYARPTPDGKWVIYQQEGAEVDYLKYVSIDGSKQGTIGEIPSSELVHLQFAAVK